MDVLKILESRKNKSKDHGKYGGFNRRMLAVTVDSFILLIFLPVINSIAPVETDQLTSYTIDPQDPRAGSHLLVHILTNQAFMQSWFVNFFLQMLAWCLYSAVFLHFWSATPGKMLLRMKVVDAKTEGRINDLQVALRSFGYLISGACLGLGFFWMGIDKRKRGWHDYLADTVVINLPLLPWKKKVPAPEPQTTEPPTTEPQPTETETL